LQLHNEENDEREIFSLLLAFPLTIACGGAFLLSPIFDTKNPTDTTWMHKMVAEACFQHHAKTEI
jgi:hypothetical protein